MIYLPLLRQANCLYLPGSTKKPNTNQNAGTPPATPAVETPASLETSVTPSRQKTPDELYKSLNDNLKSIYSALPAMTAFVLFSGHGDPRRMAELSTKRAAFETMIREGEKHDYFCCRYGR